MITCINASYGVTDAWFKSLCVMCEYVIECPKSVIGKDVFGCSIPVKITKTGMAVSKIIPLHRHDRWIHVIQWWIEISCNYGLLITLYIHEFHNFLSL